MHKYLRATIVRGNEAIPLAGIEPLASASDFSHGYGVAFLQKSCKNSLKSKVYFVEAPTSSACLIVAISFLLRLPRGRWLKRHLLSVAILKSFK